MAARLPAGLAGLLLAAGCGLVPVAPFRRPAEPQVAAEQPAQGPAASPPGAAGELGPGAPPDLPAPGDVPAAAPSGEAAQAREAAAQPAEEADERAAEAPGADGAPVVDPVGQEVRAMLEEFYAAYNGREWKRARGLFWSGATITDVRILPDSPTPAVKVATVAEFFEELARAREASPAGFEGRLEGAPVVRTASNVAQAWCQFQARFGGPQETMSWRRVDAFTFVLYEGHWKIASLAQSNNFDTR